MKTKQLLLFDVGWRRRRSTALAAFKHRHGILTCRSSALSRKEHPWLVFIPFPEDEGKDPWEIMATNGGAYDPEGRSATGEGELSAIRTLCEQMGIECDL